jgi:hypothetical protein
MHAYLNMSQAFLMFPESQGVYGLSRPQRLIMAKPKHKEGGRRLMNETHGRTDEDELEQLIRKRVVSPGYEGKPAFTEVVNMPMQLRRVGFGSCVTESSLPRFRNINFI